MRNVKPWKFGKPKTPGFGLASSFYLSVLSSRSVMPTLTQIIEPHGANGALEGFGAPLAQGVGRESLAQPLARGAYALASKDRKTVFKMLVLSKEEAGFDPEVFARSALASTVSEEAVVRIRATWTLAQFTIESHDPMVYPSLDFLLGIVQRLGELGDGVVSDPIAKRYLLPEQVFQNPRLDPLVDAREHISINMRQRPDGNHAYTLGMQKFGLPEFEIIGLLDSDAPSTSQFLIALCQSVLLGDPAQSGDRFGAPSMSFEARVGGFDRALWEGIDVLELLPPTTFTASEALAAWQAAANS
jgi:hypothetical protein